MDGGTWESLTYSIKEALKSIGKDRLFTKESLYTFLCEVKALNPETLLKFELFN